MIQTFAANKRNFGKVLRINIVIILGDFLELVLKQGYGVGNFIHDSDSILRL